MRGPHPSRDLAPDPTLEGTRVIITCASPLKGCHGTIVQQGRIPSGGRYRAVRVALDEPPEGWENCTDGLWFKTTEYEPERVAAS